mmetsp:Transcript_22653/g.49621  ORF Transcript_22653/g.49621 Transcript_22653/m.49621 type:complete len:294 (-) Transcript_22653:498-1379(-)
MRRGLEPLRYSQNRSSALQCSRVPLFPAACWVARRHLVPLTPLQKMLRAFPRMHPARLMRGICKWKHQAMALVFRIVHGTARSLSVIRIAHRTASSLGARRVARALTTHRARLIAKLRIVPRFAPKTLAHKKKARRAAAPSALLDAQGRSATCCVTATCRAKAYAISRSALGIVGIPQAATSPSAVWYARKRKAAPRIMSCLLCRLRSPCRRVLTPTKPGGLLMAGANVAQSVVSPFKPARWFAVRGRIMSALSRTSLRRSSLARIALGAISGLPRIGRSAVKSVGKACRRER